MEIAAGWIDAQRPPRLAKLLPRGESQRMTEHVADTGGRRVRARRERTLGRAPEGSKRPRLRSPVEIAEGPREVMKVMLGAVVIRVDRRKSWCWRRQSFIPSSASFMRRSISAIACVM